MTLSGQTVNGMEYPSDNCLIKFSCRNQTDFKTDTVCKYTLKIADYEYLKNNLSD